MRARGGGYIRDLVMSGARACLSLPRSTRFCLNFPKRFILPGNHMACALLQFVLAATNKIKFSYLNRNLMASKTHPPTLAFDGNTREAGDVSSFMRSNDGFVTT
jgi:hypothetical protein